VQVDPLTAERIGLVWLRAAVAPVGAFGRRHDESVAPYGPGDETRARDEIAEVVALAERLDRDGVARVRAALRAVPEPGPILARARAGDPLSDVDFYELARFVDALDALARAWDAAAAGTASAGEATDRAATAGAVCSAPTAAVADSAHAAATADSAHAAAAADSAHAAAASDCPPTMAPDRRPPVLDALREVLAPGRSGSEFYLADAFGPGLRAARAALARAEAELDARREAIAARVRDATGIDPAGEEFVVLRDAYAGPLPDDVLVVRETPTYRVGAIRAVSPQRDAALARLMEEEEAARRTLAERIARESDAVAAVTRALGALDRTLARVAFAQRWGGCVPALDGARVAFDGATFAPLADALAERARRYTPLSLDLRGVAVLTGPNMGGKSAALATAGFLCACAALGVPPPARAASLPLLDAILWIGGEGPDDRTRLLSSYAAEVVRARDALRAASPRALILVDEFARTTGPREGRALLVAFAEALRERGALALIATHFDGVAEAASTVHFRIAGLGERTLAALEAHDPTAALGASDLDAALDAVNAAMDYRIVPAREAKAESDALELARLLGLDAAVVERARALHDAD
jgi:DNA mismatch repair protein MutS2